VAGVPVDQHSSDEQDGGRPVRRWAAAVAAVLLAGGGFGVVSGSASAGGDPDNVGAPGEDGQDVTCTAYAPPVNVLFCNSVGQDGADGRSSTVHR
jgi:hypothetical protein